MNSIGADFARMMALGFRQYLVVGHPRSGTGYAAWLFQQHGLDVRHEAMGAHGTSSWQFAVHDADYPFTFDHSTKANHIFGTVIHIIREPMDAIASILHTEQASEEFRSRYVTLYGTALERAIQSYIGWNRMLLAQRADLRCKTETLHLELCSLLSCDHPVTPVRQNAREHAGIDEGDLLALPEGLKYELSKLTHYYNTLP